MYKTEAHLHTHPVSGCSQIAPDELIRLHKEAGYDTVIISDHFSRYHHARLEIDLQQVLTWEQYVDRFFTGYEAAKAAGEKYGVRVLCSAELGFGQDHFLLYGADREFFLSLPNLFDMGIRKVYPIAKAHGITVIQAHPLRNGKCTPYPDCVDGFEVINSHPRQNDDNEGVKKLADAHPHLLQTVGSDVHRPEDVGGSALLSERPVETVEDYLQLLRTKQAVLWTRA